MKHGGVRVEVVQHGSGLRGHCRSRRIEPGPGREIKRGEGRGARWIGGLLGEEGTGAYHIDQEGRGMTAGSACCFVCVNVCYCLSAHEFLVFLCVSEGS